MAKIGLALGGGGARGFAHIHVLEALDDLGIQPTIVSGSSIGAVMASGYCSGMRGKDIREYSIATFSNRAKVLGNLWKMRPTGLPSFLGKNGHRFGELDPLRVMRTLLPEGIAEDFGDLEIPARIMATNFYDMEEMIISSGSLYEAVAGSAAIPILFRPQLIQNTIVTDGGILNPVPFDVFGDQDLDLIVAVDVVGRPVGSSPELPKRMDTGYGTLQALMQKITSLKLENKQPDLLVRPDIHSFKVLDFFKVEEILWSTFETRQDTRRRLEILLKNL